MLVVDGVAAGASFAAQAQRLNEAARITIIERGPDVSFANCGGCLITLAARFRRAARSPFKRRNLLRSCLAKNYQQIQS